ncbi:MAG TPA: LamG-like jellyroll fold domain-containing protein [Puia sp.]|nr:LamG-like jellyroll fold domain-containing protein [Puia sp.]
MQNVFKPITWALAVVLLTDLAACTKAKFDDSYTKGDVPPLGDYKNSNDVAAANLLAHWTFDSTNEETISHTAPTNAVNASFVKGVHGPALHLNAGYISYPVVNALNIANYGSVSVSLWINVDNNGKTASEFFALTPGPDAQNDWGSVINVYAETGAHTVAYDDTLVLHGAVGSYPKGLRIGGDNLNDYGNRGTDFQTLHGTNKWVHYVMVYNAGDSTLNLYANNIKISNNNFAYRGNIGPIIAPIPVQPLIGAWPNAATGFAKSGVQDWQGFLTGSIDELRVYNKALGADEIHALYFFERLGN